jgi:hypothetical protein
MEEAKRHCAGTSPGSVCRAEVHWYEAHGIGRKEMKIKRFLEH